MEESHYAYRNALMRTPPDPPACPEGWTTGPPDFVGVGCQRCGTSRWWGLLSAHPHVQPPPRKELHYFDGLQGVEDAASVAAGYHRFFPRPPGRVCGEWTPRYVVDHWTPELLAAAAPEAALLVLLRDPVERFESGLAHSEHRDWRVADIAAAQVLRSAYLPQLRHLLRSVRRERLLVLQFERCVAEPAAELRRTYEHVGVDPDFRPDRLERRDNERHVEGGLTATERRQLVAWLEEGVEALGRAFPELDLSLWPNFRHLAR